MLDKTAKLRLFFGLELPDAIKQRLLTIQQPVAGARWQRADQLHLTLAFLGSVEVQQLANVRDAARNLPVKPFDLAVTGIGCFGDPDRPRNLWAGVQPAGELAELHDALVQRLAWLGFRQEKRRFRPHITLSRFRKGAGSVSDLLRVHKSLVSETFLVDGLALFESIQEKQGSVYRIVERFPFAGTE